MRHVPVLLAIAGCVTPIELSTTDEAVTTDAVTPQTTCPAGQWCVETAPVSGSPLLHAVWAVNANDVFAVGDSGTIVRRVNGAWTVMTSNTTANLRGVWAASSSDVWAVGVGGAIVRFNGTS